MSQFIYETIYSACKEQRSIVDNGLDLPVPSSTFGAPRVTDMGLAFYGGDRRGGLAAVVFRLRHGRCRRVLRIPCAGHPRGSPVYQKYSRGVTIYTISLSFSNLPYYHTWEVPHLSTLSKSPSELLQSAKDLGVNDSSSALELLTVPLRTRSSPAWLMPYSDRIQYPGEFLVLKEIYLLCWLS